MLRVRDKRSDEKYFYALEARDSRLVRLIGLLGIATTVFVVLGYIQFLYISLILALFFSPVLIIIVLYNIIQYLLLASYPGFDITRHKQRVLSFWKTNKPVPKIAVFIPAAGESVDIVELTVKDAINIRYPSFDVFLLDDSKNAIYHDLAATYGIRYIRRQNIGHFKKAGNMNHALGRITGYDNILVLDADFRPRSEILLELAPYAAKDVGIIQTPQHFQLDGEAHARSKIEYGAAYIQQDFYRITQVARNKFGAAICVGTSALYNVEALKQVGGYEGVGQPKGWSHSEDVHTGLKMLNSYNSEDKRYKILYVPVQLTKGMCPDDHQSFYKQQNRWATGSMQLLLSDKSVRSNRLSAMQRLIYGSNSLYYFYTMSILLSPLYLLALALSSQPSSWAFTLYFIPSLAFKYIVEPYVLRKERAPFATSLVVLSNAYTFLQALILLAIKRPMGWEATGSKSAKKSPHFSHFKLGAMTGFISLYLLTLAVLIFNEHFQVGPSLFIICLFLTSFLAHISFLFYTLIIATNARRRIFDRKLYAFLVLLFATGGTVYGSVRYHSDYNVTLKSSQLSLEKQSTHRKTTETPIDGYRRTVGDLKEMFRFQK